MGKFVEETGEGSALEKLTSSAFKEVTVMARRQMDEMEYLKEDCDIDSETLAKLM